MRWSLPMRERELKQCGDGEKPVVLMSLPMRERELKLRAAAERAGVAQVAPHAGA